MRDINTVTLVEGQPLVLGGSATRFGKDFPLGQGWRKTSLRIGINVNIGTGAGPIANSALLFIKKIFMKTDKNEILANISGRALYEMLAAENGTLAQVDPSTQVAAASGTTYVYLDIPHLIKRKFKNPNDTILDTGRYKSITLEITLGTIADLFTAPGTATVTATLDAEAEVTATVLPGKAQPNFYRSLYELEPVIPTVQQYLELDRAQDMAVMKAMIGTFKTATAGVPFTGVGNNAVIGTFDVKDLSKFYVQNRLFGFSRADDKNEYNLESVRDGITFVEFSKDDSVYSALYTGNKSQLRVVWRNATVVGTDQVAVAYDAIRGLAGASMAPAG